MKIQKCTPFCLFVLSLIFQYNLHAQASIQGLVKDTNGPLAFANVLLLHEADSSLVRGTVTDENGSYSLEDINSGRYLLSSYMLGFEHHYQVLDLPASGRISVNEILLHENITKLDVVTVTAKKPLFEQKIDRTVINVAGSITAAGSTALEVLERSPGVIVNRQNNAISLAGKDGVIVMMNGKINRMPIEAVVQLLEGMPSSNIEKIELITTPPADFDAEGNAGFINIVLKQTSDRGLNGSFTLSGGYGKGETAMASLNFNYRKKQLNLYGDYSYGRDARDQFATIKRQALIKGINTRTETITDRMPVQRNHNARLGLDWEISKKTIFGLLLSTYDNRWEMDAVNNTTLFSESIPNGWLDINTDELNHWRHFGSNLNLKHHFKDGGDLNFDVDFLLYDNENPTDYLNSSLDENGNFLSEERTFSGKITPIKVSVGKIDYSKRFAEKLKIEMGVKATVARFDNDVTVAKLQNGTMVNDPELTAEYKLEETVAAAYTSFDIKVDEKSDMKLGLRYEHTQSNLGTPEQANIVDRNYGNFFPGFFLSRKFSDNYSANISYSRRITRPTFNDLAPFVMFIDPFTLFSGNAALQPSISNNVKLDYRLKTVLLSVQYTVEDSAIARFQPQFVEGENQLLIYATNMKNRKTLSFTAAFPIELTDWWRMQNNFTGSWQEANSFLYDAPFKASTKSLRVVWINSFKLPYDFSAELVGFYQSRVLFGTIELQPLGAINIGLQKKFKNNHGALRFAIDDLFNTMNNRFQSAVPEQNLEIDARFRFRFRSFKLSYTRSFGNNKLKSTRQRGTGSEEERKRVTN